MTIGVQYSQAGADIKNDVWYSTDGATRTLDGTASWSARQRHTSVVTSDSVIWVIGGYEGVEKKDVWFTDVPTAVELLDFSGIGRDGFIELSWLTELEIDNLKWVIVRAEDRGQMQEDRSNYEQIAEVPAKESFSDYEYIDSLVGVDKSSEYWYKLGDVDNNGNITWHGPVSAIVGGSYIGPAKLAHPIPSPFKERVKIEYWLKQEDTPCLQPQKDRIPVRLEVYNEGRQVVNVLVKEEQSPGRHSMDWNGKDSQGNPISAGTYFYHLKDGTLTRKLLHIK